MRILDYIYRLHKLIYLLKMEQTGSLAQMAEKMGIKRRSVYNYMNELRAMGAEIEYDRKKNTYFFKTKIEIELIIKD